MYLKKGQHLLRMFQFLSAAGITVTRFGGLLKRNVFHIEVALN